MICDVMLSPPLLIDGGCLTGKSYCCDLDNNVHSITKVIP